MHRIMSWSDSSLRDGDEPNLRSTDREWQLSVDEYNARCGCEAGAAGFIVSFLTALATTLFVGISLGETMILTIGAAIFGGVFGKATGLAIARSQDHWGWRRLLTELVALDR